MNISYNCGHLYLISELVNKVQDDYSYKFSGLGVIATKMKISAVSTKL